MFKPIYEIEEIYFTFLQRLKQLHLNHVFLPLLMELHRWILKKIQDFFDECILNLCYVMLHIFFWVTITEDFEVY